jgi:hypothetical protein
MVLFLVLSLASALHTSVRDTFQKAAEPAAPPASEVLIDSVLSNGCELLLVGLIDSIFNLVGIEIEGLTSILDGGLGDVLNALILPQHAELGHEGPVLFGSSHLLNSVLETVFVAELVEGRSEGILETNDDASVELSVGLGVPLFLALVDDPVLGVVVVVPQGAFILTTVGVAILAPAVGMLGVLLVLLTNEEVANELSVAASVVSHIFPTLVVVVVPGVLAVTELIGVLPGAEPVVLFANLLVVLVFLIGLALEVPHIATRLVVVVAAVEVG